VLQALKKASLLVMAELDLRAREAAQIKSDLSASTRCWSEIDATGSSERPLSSKSH
jgi:hypothetical protein